MKNKKLVMGLLALSVFTLIGNLNISFANEVKPLNKIKHIDTLQKATWSQGWYVTADELNVRSGPGTNYSALDSLSYGHEISVDTSSKTNGFYFIMYLENKEVKRGWVSAKYVAYINA